MAVLTDTMPRANCSRSYVSMGCQLRCCKIYLVNCFCTGDTKSFPSLLSLLFFFAPEVKWSCFCLSTCFVSRGEQGHKGRQKCRLDFLLLTNCSKSFIQTTAVQLLSCIMLLNPFVCINLFFFCLSVNLSVCFPVC